MTTTDAPPPAAASRLRGAPAGPLLTAGFALGACVAVNLVDPNVDGSLGWCPFKVMTGGLDCPGCGVLRATRALTRGDVVRALDHNLLWTLMAPLLVWGLVGWWRHERGARPRRPTAPTWFVPAGAVVVTVFWIVRNLPSGSWLASGIG